MSLFKKINKDKKDVFLESVRVRQEELLEKIRVKCPYCKDEVPSTALRCAHCAGDLTVKEIRAKIDEQVAAYQKKQRTNGFVGFAVVVAVIAIIVYASSGDKSSTPPQSTSVAPVSNFSYICSRTEGPGHTAYYYLVNSYGTNQSFSLNERIADVTVRVSTVANRSGNWDTTALCSTQSLDLPDSQWQVLAAGSDCGIGVSKSPCDVSFIADTNGVSGIIVAPELNGYTSSGVMEYAKKGALIKVTGTPIKQ